jgi:hypothetical protein
VTSPDLITYIDSWLDDHAWHLDSRTIDFALDVRLMASAAQDRPADDALPRRSLVSVKEEDRAA